MNAVRWSPVEHIVATGGADRKVHLWDVSKRESSILISYRRFFNCIILISLA